MSISFLLDEKPTIVRGGCGQSGREAREISFIQLLARNSERAAPSACVGKQFSTVRLSGIDRLDELSFPHSLRFTGSFANGSSTRDRPNSGPTHQTQQHPVVLGIVDRCRCYGAKSRSPRVSGLRKGTGDCPWAGRRNWLVAVSTPGSTSVNRKCFHEPTRELAILAVGWVCVLDF